jgi:hypothetical protein
MSLCCMRFFLFDFQVISTFRIFAGPAENRHFKVPGVLNSRWPVGQRGQR